MNFVKPKPKHKTKETIWYHWLAANSFKVHSGIIKKREYVGVTGLGMFWRYDVIRDDGYRHPLCEGQMFETEEDARRSRNKLLQGYIKNASSRIKACENAVANAKRKLEYYQNLVTE